MNRKMRNIRAEIEKTNEIITLPSILAEIMGELGKEEAVTHKVTRMVETDPSLTSSILRVANSPFYGVRRRIDSVGGAITLLGLSEISRLLITFYMKQQLRALSQSQQSSLAVLWTHSVNTASIAALIAREYELPTSGKEYTAGLLHDMGKIVMLQFLPAEYEKSIQARQGTDKDDTESETAIVGIPHTEVGALLGEKWRLPVEFIEVMKYHHTPRNSTQCPELCAVVRFADLLAESWGTGIGERTGATAAGAEDVFAMLGNQEPRVKAVGLQEVVAQLSEKHVEQKSLVGLL
jgi:putative nucleotidyltransferase with HDIG domain